MHFKWNYEPPTSERQTAAKELAFLPSDAK